MTKPAFRWTSTAVVLVLFAFLGALEALSVYVQAVQLGRPATLASVLNSTWPSWVLQMALAWPLVRFSRWARVGPATWRWAVPVHVLGAALFVVVTLLGTAFFFKLLGQLGTRTIGAVFMRSLPAFTSEQVTVYLVVVGVVHALDYLRESEERERERARLAVSLMETRLNALRSQLSPHFFFNTLNAISTFALQGRPELVGEMVGALGELMRASLDDRLPHEVPLSRELALLGLYLDIQRVRFHDWLRVEEEIAPDAREMLVPSLLLQPLVENAIEHGGADGDGLHRVVVRCALAAGGLVITIENPPPDGASPLPTHAGAGVGLRNTRERLAQLYGGASALESGVEPGRGFVTTVRIPARRAAAAPHAPVAGPAA